jgi:Nif-specific regulatory protein
MRVGAEREAIPWLEQSLDGLSKNGDQRARAGCLRDLGFCKSNLRLPDAENCFRNALVLWQDVGDTAEELRTSVGLARDLVRHARLEEASVELEQIVSRARSTNSQRMLQFGLSLLCQIAAHRAHLDDALRFAEEAADGALYLGNAGAAISSRNNHCAALIACGRPSEAAELMRATLDRFGEKTEPEPVDYARILLANALIEKDGPASTRARELLETGLRNARARRSLRQVLVGLVIEMERRSHSDCNEPFDPVRSEYDAHIGMAASEEEAEIVVRAELATAASLLKRSEGARALVAAESAAHRAVQSDLLIYAPLAELRRSEALSATGNSTESDEALERGRRLLEQASERIRDVSIRRDFLARAAFRRLRDAGRPAEEERRLTALYEIIHALNSETDPEAVLSSILDSAIQVLQAERGMILLRDSEGEEFTVRLARNLEKETVADLEAFSHGIVGQAGKGESVLAIDAGHDSRFDAFASIGLYGIRSLLCVPLRSRSKMIGTVYLDSRREGRLFTEADLKFLEAFANHAALALVNVQTRARLLEENRRLQRMAETRVKFDNITGRSTAMQKVFDLIPRVAASEQPVLIQGESGTGKELVARAIHLHGPRKNKVFLSENCAALAETLLESELFGHVRGAFTGADKDHPGLFEQATGGTLFLDEVGDMTAAMQARLLRVLQEGEVRRVGGDRAIKVDVRVLAATHRDLQAEVAAGRFREDLLYRLQVLVIQLPPLRERPGDIPLLVHHILDRISRERGRSSPVVERDVMDMLEKHPWPGNVRQMENALHRLVIHARDDVISRDAVEADTGLRQMLLGPEKEPLFSLERTEKAQIERALEASGGNRERAAKLLGISRATIFRKIREYKLG